MKFLKKFVALALVLASVMSLCAPALAADTPQRVLWVSASPNVNMRATAGGAYMMKVPKGTALYEYENVTKDGVQWSKVQYNNKTGYIQTQYLSTRPVSYTSRTVTCTSGSTVNLRKMPSKSANLVTTIKKGTTVNTAECPENGWYAVSYGNYFGFMMAEFLTGTSGGSSTQSTWQTRYGTVDFKETSTWREGVSNFQHDLNYYFNNIATTQPNNWETLAEDGYFGYKSSYATLVFQQQNNLTADGIAGPKTKEALFNLVPHD